MRGFQCPVFESNFPGEHRHSASRPPSLCQDALYRTGMAATKALTRVNWAAWAHPPCLSTGIASTRKRSSFMCSKMSCPGLFQEGNWKLYVSVLLKAQGNGLSRQNSETAILELVISDIIWAQKFDSVLLNDSYSYVCLILNLITSSLQHWYTFITPLDTNTENWDTSYLSILRLLIKDALVTGH